MGLNHWIRLIFLGLSFAFVQIVSAQEQDGHLNNKVYQVQPGDILSISVWKEDGLQQDVLVRPDGGISFPLAGDFKVQGLSLDDIRQIITERLSKLISGPVVSVSARQLTGHKIFVIGKVSRPGEFVVDHYIDVMQALTMAGGMTQFSSVNNIKILRRDNEGRQFAIDFRYGDVEDGEDLQQNIILRSGDVVVVP